MSDPGGFIRRSQDYQDAQLSEEWKAIPMAPGYEASSNGEIRSLTRSVQIGGSKPHTQIRDGRPIVPRDNGRYLVVDKVAGRRQVMVHHLIASAFLGPRPDGFVLDHIDRNRHNNTPSNLRYVPMTVNRLNTSATGVSQKKCGTWEARVTHRGEDLYLGTFPDEESASRTRDAVRDAIIKAECSASESLQRALADLAAEQTAHVNTGARCAALGHTLDAMTERAEKAEHRIGLFKNECMFVHKERDAANLSARDARAEADALRAELAAVSDAIGTCAFMDPPDGGSPTLAEQVRRMRKALDESDAVGKSNYEALTMARAERDALKARKVKLPAKASPDSLFSGKDQALWGGAIDACAAAIRAAGIEVES